MIGNYQDCYNTFYRSNYRRTLLLRYEEIYENFDFLLSQIEDLFLLEIDPEQKELIKKYFCKEAMLAETYQYENFNQYDPITGIHGNHISDYYWLKIIPKIYILHVLNRLQPTMEQWNYPIDSQKYNNQILRKRSSPENAQSGL